jgi:hypothetical protein
VPLSLGDKIVEFKCVKEGCKKTFKPGEWECFPGELHEVEQKTYHIGTGIADLADRAKSRVTVFVTNDREHTDSSGQKHNTPARAIVFVGGAFSTTNPEDQFFFETKFKRELISPEEWQRQYIHPGELMKMKQREVDQRMKRVEQMENDLLRREQEAKERAAALEAETVGAGKKQK